MTPEAEQDLILLVGELKRGVEDLGKQRIEDVARGTKKHEDNQKLLREIQEEQRAQRLEIRDLKQEALDVAISTRKDFDNFYTDEFGPVEKTTNDNASTLKLWRWLGIVGAAIFTVIGAVVGWLSDHYQDIHFG